MEKPPREWRKSWQSSTRADEDKTEIWKIDWILCVNSQQQHRNIDVPMFIGRKPMGFEYIQIQISCFLLFASNFKDYTVWTFVWFANGHTKDIRSWLVWHSVGPHDMASCILGRERIRPFLAEPIEQNFRPKIDISDKSVRIVLGQIGWKFTPLSHLKTPSKMLRTQWFLKKKRFNSFSP